MVLASFHRTVRLGLFGILCLLAVSAVARQALYQMPAGQQTRWTSPENPHGEKGRGALENHGAKGRAFVAIPAHGQVDLLETRGPGIVDRIKLTIDRRTPEALRSLRIAMYWDGASKPAVTAPLGDFFGDAFGRTASFDNAVFSNPEGRSFAVTLPMPYRTGARIVIYNDSDARVDHLFYEVSYRVLEHAPEHMLYFHAYWHQAQLPVGKDFPLLPEIHGHGRFLGVAVGIRANPAYVPGGHGKDTPMPWFGEGEVKIYLDGDRAHPTLVGTGVEDYFGSAWGMKRFITPFDGCTVADDHTGMWSCYRYHLPDPVYFDRDIRVTVQQIGGGPLAEVRKLAASGAPMKLVSVDQPGHFHRLLSDDHPPRLDAPDFPDGWVNYFRSDLWSSVAYFYLDSPTDRLPAIAPWPGRLKGTGSD